MGKPIKVLFAGEAITKEIIIYKGWDSLHLANFEEHGKFFINALVKNGIEVDYIPTNRITEEFPWNLDEMKKYDVISLSDVGSKTILIAAKTMAGEKTPNRLKLLKEYVSQGGGFIMWGGYLSFSGYHGYAQYEGTPMEEILPVKCLMRDDTVEVPEGFLPKILMENHPILNGVPKEWGGWFLSYNKLIAKEEADVIAVIEEYDNDPFLAVWDYGKGRTIASAVDCAHHGAAPSFLNWEYTNVLYSNMVKWAARAI